MDSIIDERAGDWRKRIRACYDEYKKADKEDGGTGKVSQAELARRINEKYCNDVRLPSVNQVAISRWLNLGANGRHDASFPPAEVIIMLADFFGVSVGYLLGETECKTFEMEDAVAYLGLSEKAIEQIRLATRYETAFRTVHMMSDEAGEVISSLVCSKGFFNLVMEFKEMSRIYDGPNIQEKLFRELEEKYGGDMVARALDFEPHEYKEEEVDPEFAAAYEDVREAIDRMAEADYARRASAEAVRFNLIKQFSRIVDEIYPE